jgi:hypothetical protein
MVASAINGYSSLDHVARSLWLNVYHKDNLMAMLYSAYFDASGKQDVHPSITVAGAVAPLKKWESFCVAWSKILAEEGVTEFHATDFAASLDQYEGWKGDKPRRSAFLKRLGTVIKNHANKFFIVTVEIEAWKSVNEKYLLSEIFQSPFALGGYSVVRLVKKWAERKR